MTDPFQIGRPKVKHRSVSQVTQFERCPHATYLARHVRAWDRPAAWLPMGTAGHSAVEAWEKSGRTMTEAEALEVYRTEYAAGVNKMAEDTPNLSLWFNSGPYAGEQDIERRFLVGQEHVTRYINWYQGKGSNQAIWITPDGTPAIELGFDIDLDGVQVKGYIDQVIDGFGPRDVKTGKDPGDTFQLKTYAVALEEQYGVDFQYGDYFMTRKVNPPTQPYDLSLTSRQEIVDRFHAADEGIKAENFDPNPGPNCARCPFATACEFAVPDTGY